MATKRTRDVEEVRRKQAARTRFRKLVRSVILNRQWLNEPEEDQGISMNVKKNVAMLVRKKRKVGNLSMAEKALIRSSIWNRSVEDRKKLCTIIAGLTCFAKIPPKLRARMVPVIKFMAVNADRVIMKTGDLPITVYYIVSGEIEMKRKVFNKVTRETELISEAIYGPGDSIGEVEMLEDIRRTHTYVSNTQCELLLLFDSDYWPLLGPYMKKKWHEKKVALNSLDYFNFLSTDQIVEACKYGNIVQYDPLESIYYEDKGTVSYVHFVLSGECVILQCLHMKVTQKKGRRVLELPNIRDGTTLFNTNDSERSLRSVFVTEPVFDINELLASSSDDDNTKKKTLRAMGLREIEMACGLYTPKKKMRLNYKTIYKMGRTCFPLYEYDDEHEDELECFTDEYSEEVETEESYQSGQSVHEFSDVRSIKSQRSKRSVRSVRSNISKRSLKSQRSGSHHTIISNKSVSMVDLDEDEDDSDDESEIYTATSSAATTKSSSRTQLGPALKPRTEYETHFIDVGSLTFGAIFGLGERMDHRVIMARTLVQCLILPRFWLFEEAQNPGNMWQRRRFDFECNVPSREALFNDFLKTRKWDKFRRDYIQSCLQGIIRSSDTQVEDIPIMCRIVETADDDTKKKKKKSA